MNKDVQGLIYGASIVSIITAMGADLHVRNG